MRAMAIDRFGGPEEFQLVDRPDPKVGPDVVLIDVRAAGVNPVDAGLRQGGLEAYFPHVFPLVLGWDVAGVVAGVGPAVTGLAPGDEVYGYVRKDFVGEGAYAERVAMQQRGVAKKAASLSFEEAGGIPLAGLTAHQSLHDKLGIGAEDTLLVHAAAGGVGHLAVQIAKAAGARVLGTASEPKHEFVRGLGAEPIDYRGGDLAAKVRELAPDGVDAVLDTIGGDTLTGSRELLRPGGRIVSIVQPPDPAFFAERDIATHYLFVRPDAEDLQALAQLTDSGRLRPHLEDVLALDQVASAHERIEAGHVTGKLVLRI